MKRLQIMCAGILYAYCIYIYCRSIAVSSYRVGQKTGPLCFTAYNFRNIKQIFTKFRKNQSHFILNIVP